MRKLAFLMALMLVLSFSACSRAPQNTPDTDTTGTTAPLWGENDGATYKNTHFGLTFTPQSGWDLFDNDEIAERNLPILSLGENQDYADAVSHAKEFYDMYAVQESTGNTIGVRVENLATMYDFMPSAVEYRDIQLSMLEGIPQLTTEAFTATVDGKEFLAMKVLWGEGDDVQTDVSVFVLRDNYLLALELSSTDGDHTDEWLSGFKWL